MNILFYTVNEVAPQYGGVERITANIATALTTFYNANCYSAYKTTLTVHLRNNNSSIQSRSHLTISSLG